MIINAQNEIIGFHMIGNSVCEISIAAELMIKKRLTVDELRCLIYAHPSYGEIIGELAGMF